MKDLSNDTVSAERDALRAAYANAIVATTRETADEVCTKAGATAGVHPWRRVPANKVAAATAELEKMVAANPSARQPERRERSAFAQGSTTKPKPQSFAQAFNDAKVADVYAEWNTPKTYEPGNPACQDDDD